MNERRLSHADVLLADGRVLLVAGQGHSSLAPNSEIFDPLKGVWEEAGRATRRTFHTLTLVPEEPFDIEEVCEGVRRRHDRGRYASVVVVAEGARPKPDTIPMPDEEVDRFGHVRLGGIGNLVAAEIESRTGFETRVTILGHVQRGGTPTAFDRVLASRFGVAAVDAVHDGGFGMMTALVAGDIVLVPLADAVGDLKRLSAGVWEAARVFFA